MGRLHVHCLHAGKDAAGKLLLNQEFVWPMKTARGAFQRKGGERKEDSEAQSLGEEARPEGQTGFELLGKVSGGANGEKTLSLLTA